MKTPANVILIGFMGSGKTRVAGLLSRKLGFQFLDMDRLIEEKERMPVADIFRVKGEDFFRSLERDLVRELTSKERQVIATGGGAWLDGENRSRLLAGGWCAWLKAGPEQVWDRVKARLSERPILAAAPDPILKIRELMESRRIAYEMAPVHIETDDRTPEEVAEELMSRLSKDHPFDLSELQK